MNKRPKKDKKKFKTKTEEKEKPKEDFFASKVIENKRAFTVRPDKKRG